MPPGALRGLVRQALGTSHVAGVPSPAGRGPSTHVRTPGWSWPGKPVENTLTHSCRPTGCKHRQAHKQSRCPFLVSPTFEHNWLIPSNSRSSSATQSMKRLWTQILIRAREHAQKTAKLNTEG